MQLVKTKDHEWKFWHGDELLIIWYENGKVYFENGPENPTARAHEGMGGSQSIEEFFKDPYPWVDAYGLRDELFRELLKITKPHLFKK